MTRCFPVSHPGARPAAPCPETGGGARRHRAAALQSPFPLLTGLLLGGLLLALGCGGGGGDGSRPASASVGIVLVPSAWTVSSGGTVTLSAAIADSSGVAAPDGDDVTFASALGATLDNPATKVVRGGATVVYRAPTVATLTQDTVSATWKDQSGSLKLTVTP